ncbi:zinc-dependent alcohol dehydrogenase family protein [Halothermothrix orenii]|uniref:L-threonine 3-dehydrogenase n=1 Tax=Halothermothrix orenii (strain H 168 / OCM 544 / DSM 9562) TaxID=373903 RepID=B8CXP1_HALOH|nr:zinc-dependent alcohol dehydrogenase family protein [Halothermothrix orenii]ACL70060.1 L-threonine 3-dehydrogenase [Halothermothrix orenii H 168]
MKSLVFYGPGNVKIEDKEIPKIDENEVLVKVKAAGICGTDRHIYRGEAPARTQVILGHENAGEIIETGRQVRSLKKGDKVCIDPNIFCGQCYYCHRGEVHLCKELQAIGVTRNGGFAEYLVAPATNVYKVKENVSYKEMALVEPLACCLHGIDLAGIRPGDFVVILGAGAIGLILLQLALHSGASEVIVSEPNSKKRKLALKLGASKVFDPFNDNLEKEIKIIKREGADVVIEAVGNIHTFKQSIQLARKGGSVLLFGVPPKDKVIEINPFEIYKRELKLKGAYINPFVTDRAVRILESGMVNLKKLVTSQYTLEELPNVLDGNLDESNVKSLVIY